MSPSRLFTILPGLTIAGFTLALPSIILSRQPAPVDKIAMALAEAKKAGVSFDEKDVMRPFVVKPEDDARPGMKVVFDGLRRVKYDPEKLDSSPESSIETADSLASDKELVQRLGAALSKLSYKPDSFATGAQFKELANFKLVVKILCAAAQGEASRKNWPLATQYLTWACKVGKWCGKEPGAISGLVQVAIDAIVLARVGRVLSDAKGSPEAQVLGTTIIGEISPPYDLRNAFPFEPYATSQNFLHPYEKQRSELPLLQDIGPEHKATPTPAEAKELERLVVEAIQLGVLQTKSVQKSSFPAQYDSIIRATQEFEKGRDQHNEVMAGFDTELLKSLKNSMVKKLAHRLCMAAAIDLFRFNGKFPDKYAFAHDSAGVSEQLRYKKTPDGFQLYWIGANGTDDGGPPAGVWARGKEPNDDLGYTYPVPVKKLTKPLSVR